MSGTAFGAIVLPPDCASGGALGLAQCRPPPDDKAEGNSPALKMDSGAEKKPAAKSEASGQN
jgi:hypothetical protein